MREKPKFNNFDRADAGDEKGSHYLQGLAVLLNRHHLGKGLDTIHLKLNEYMASKVRDVLCQVQRKIHT